MPTEMAPPADQPSDNAHRQPNEGGQSEHKKRTSDQAKRQILIPPGFERFSRRHLPPYPCRQHSHARDEESDGNQADATAHQVDAAIQSVTIKLLIAENPTHPPAPDPGKRAQPSSHIPYFDLAL